MYFSIQPNLIAGYTIIRDAGDGRHIHCLGYSLGRLHPTAEAGSPKEARVVISFVLAGAEAPKIITGHLSIRSAAGKLRHEKHEKHYFFDHLFKPL